MDHILVGECKIGHALFSGHDTDVHISDSFYSISDFIMLNFAELKELGKNSGNARDLSTNYQFITLLNSSTLRTSEEYANAEMSMREILSKVYN